MTKIPDVNSINWGESFNKFLTQLLDPETGSINVWNDDTRPGGITGVSGVDKGKCGWNTTKGCLERFDGNRWVELRSYITEVATPLITSNNNTIPNTQWVNQKVNKALEDFTAGTLEAYISSRVKEILRNEIIPEVKLIMQTYRTLEEISGTSYTNTKSNIEVFRNSDNLELFDIKISFDEQSYSPIGIYVSLEENVWMGYDHFLSKDLLNKTVLTPIKGEQGIYTRSGTLLGVSLDPSWILHLVTNPSELTPNTFTTNVLDITKVTFIPSPIN